MNKYYKSPLTLYVVWHPNFVDGIKYAESIYNTFCRDTDSPLSRGLNIPVNFRYIPAYNNKIPIDIDISLSDRNAIIILIDDEMFEDSPNWNDYISILLDKENETTRIFPIALSNYAFHLNEEKLSKKQFINLTQLKKNDISNDLFKNKWAELKSRLLHDLSRLFFKLPKLSDTQIASSKPPIKLFVSHAKADGETLAIEFRDYVLANTKLKTFFDVNDIADAADFEKEISNNLKNSAIVVFLSDAYSTREWCRIEVLVAKRNKSPLVVVNNIKRGEKRSFPYLGNVPTLRYKKNSFNDIIDLALFQVLNNLYLEEKIKKEIELYKLEDKFKVYQIENAPELFNYIDIKRLQKNDIAKDILVIYPDPPLGTEELNILNEIDDKISFITPSLINKIIESEKK